MKKSEANFKNRPNEKKEFFLSIDKVVFFLVVVGLFSRLLLYLKNVSLSRDELAIALLLRDHSVFDLIHPFSLFTDSNEYAYHIVTAPLGFLLAVKALVTFLGNNEYVLRLLPFVASFVSIILFNRVASNVLEGKSKWLALSLFSISESLLYYSAQLKPYSIDVLSTLILYLGFYRLTEKDCSNLQFLFLVIGGGIIIWFSFPSVFVMPALVLVYALSKQNNKRKLFHIIVVCGLWLTSFLIYYFKYLRIFTLNTSLFAYWRHSYFPIFETTAGQTASWLLDAFFRFSIFSITFVNAYGSLLFFAIGAFLMFLKQRRQFFIYFLPILITLLASALHKYPFYDRLILFLVPSYIIFLSKGIGFLWERVSKFNRFFGHAFIALLLACPILLSAELLLRPLFFEDIKPVLSYVREHHQKGDIIYVYYGAKKAFDYYAPRYGLDNTDHIMGTFSRGFPQKYVNELKEIKGRKRAWILFSHIYEDEAQIMVQHLNKNGKKLLSTEGEDVSAYLYDLSARPRLK